MALTLTVLASGLCVPSAHAKKPYVKMSLPPQVTEQLDLVLKMTEALHGALLANDENVITTQIQAVRYSLDAAVGAASKKSSRNPSTIYDRNLEMMLYDARRLFQSAQAARGEDQTQVLKEAFRQVVMLLKAYDIGKSYLIYFCPKDRAVWFQKSRKPRYPFANKDKGNCAVQVK